MMRTLHLLRHGKAAADSPTGTDHGRGLTSRGRNAATAMGALLETMDSPPDFVLCSSARRALETWDAVRSQLSRDPGVSVEDDLYLVDADTLLERVQEVDDAYASVLLVGHNPGIGALAHALARRTESEDYDRLSRSFPTAALATLRFDRETWAEVSRRRGELAGFRTPKSIDAPR